MEKIIKSKRDSFDSICYAIKALGLFFCFYPLFEKFFNYSPMASMSEINMSSMVVSAIMLLMVLSIWLVLQTNHNTRSARKWLEIGTFFGVCLASVIVSGGSESTYKFLFVLLIVTYTIQYGMRYGMLIAIVASVALLGIDLVAYSVTDVSTKSFQSDVAMSFMFIVISYILGWYVRLENEHIGELIRLANFDSLTGLYNHRYFHEVMEKQWKSAAAKGKKAAVVMMDIDYFKLYNDFCGHQAGDTALAQVAGLIRDNIRPQDIACRYGGEEFAVIMPDTTSEEAIGLSEKIRVAVMNEAIDGEEYMPGKHLTVSLGVSENNVDDNSYGEMVTRADNALYRAKYLRKNRVESYQNVFDQFTGLDGKTKNALLPISGLVGIINVRDDYTYSHTERVAMCCSLVAKYLKFSESDMQTLLISAYMHDVGKINVPREILIAGRKLTDDEWQVIKNHPAAGQAILNQISGMELVGEIVSQHHERYNGKGYPRGLSGDQIHPLASILALADSFDAMTNDRPYQKKRSVDNALDEIERCAGTMYHPEYASLFVEAIRSELDRDDYTSMTREV